MAGRSRKHKNSDKSDASGRPSAPDDYSGGKSKGNGEGQETGGRPNGQRQDSRPAKGAHRARSSGRFPEVADDMECKRRDKNLSIILALAGLLFTVAAIFIININRRLRPDSPKEEAGALPSALIHQEIGDTGSDVPPLSGPAREAALKVRAVLYVSLTLSTLSAFFAIIGKQLLKRRAAIQDRGRD